MEVVTLTVGIVLLTAGTIDILWTTLWVQGGAGPLTSQLMKRGWQILGRTVGEHPKALTLSGPLILGSSLAVWILLLWSGWTFVFASGEPSLYNVSSGRALSWGERFYFTGYTIFTLGNGGYAPQSGVWQIATVFAAGSGMLFVTLAVTYVLSVLGAVTQKRAFASSVSGLGETTDEIIRTSWDGETFRGLDIQLTMLASDLETLTANHKAYPILHYFHSKDPKNAPVTSIVVLDELLTFLQFGTPEETRPDDLVVQSTRSSVQGYLETLHEAFVDAADRSPPPLDLRALREEGIPTVSDEEFRDALTGVDDRRHQLLGLVDSDLRDWPNRGDQ